MWEVVYGNPGDNFSEANCYDSVEQQIDVENCIIFIEKAILSPKGNELAFIGTNPNVTDPSLAESNLDVWKVRRDGADHEWIGANGESYVAKTLAVHPRP